MLSLEVYFNTVLETKRLILRPYLASDYKVWSNGYSQRKPHSHIYDDGPYEKEWISKKYFLQTLQVFKEQAEKDEMYVFGIFHKKTNQNLGHVDLATIARKNNHWANLGYLVHNQFQNKGFAKEAALAALEIGFTKLHYHRVEAAITKDNLRSIAVAKAIQLKKECIRKKFFFDNNEWKDQIIFVKIASAIKRPLK